MTTKTTTTITRITTALAEPGAPGHLDLLDALRAALSDAMGCNAVLAARELGALALVEAVRVAENRGYPARACVQIRTVFVLASDGCPSVHGYRRVMEARTEADRHEALRVLVAALSASYGPGAVRVLVGALEDAAALRRAASRKAAA